MPKSKTEPAFTRLPDDWKPSAELMAWARAKRSDLTLEEIQDQVEIFSEYWVNQQGKKAEKKDWNRAFQTWMRRAVIRRPYGYRPPGNGGVVV